MKLKTAPLKVALVGCGNVVQNSHCPALLQLEHQGVLKVAGILEPVLTEKHKIRRKFPGAMVVDDLADLFDLEIDFAIVGSPTYLHAQQSLQLLGSGISVLCEKPMARTVSEAQAMIDAAAANQVHLAVGLLGRFATSTAFIRDAVRAGVLGDLQSVYICRGDRYSGPLEPNWRFQKDLAGGGVLMEVGVHLLDLLIWCFDYPTSIVSYQDDAVAGLEANCNLQLQFAGGFNAEVRFSRDFYLPSRIVIRGSLGWIQQDGAYDTLRLGFNDCKYSLAGQLQKSFDGQAGFITSPVPPAETDLFLCQLQNFVDVLLGRGELLVPGAEGIKSLMLIEQCYEVRQLMPMDWLDAEEFSGAQRAKARVREC